MSVLGAIRLSDGTGGEQPGATEASTGSATRVIAGRAIALFSDTLVFKPTLTTSLLTEQVLSSEVSIQTVLDLGCGSGPIAVVLALAGAGHVYATDLMPRACELARKNAVLNKVEAKITVLQGNLFEPVRDTKFDLIVDDVSGVAEEVARLSSWFHPDVPSGGFDGTNLTIQMLRQADLHLKPGGHLFFPVLSLSNSKKIVAVAREIFGERLTRVASKPVPFNQELKEHLDALLRLRNLGLIHFEQVRSRLFWSLDIYRADAAD